MTTDNILPPPLPSSPKTSALAVWSLVCGILSFCLLFIAGIPAVILGIVALNKIKASRGALGGQGLAIGGIAAGAAGTVMVSLLIVIAIPGCIRSRQLSQGRAIIYDTLQIDAAIDQWALENGKVNGSVVDCAAVANYLKDGPLKFKVAALGHEGGEIQDVLPLKTIKIGKVGMTQVQIAPEAKAALPAVRDWGMY